MTASIQVETLPVTAERIRRKRLLQDRGELAIIEDGRTFRHLGYFSLKAGGGFFRGGHYHLEKTESFYVVTGKLRVRLVDVASGETTVTTLAAGQVAHLPPGVAHRFEALEDAQVIEYYDALYDVGDDVPYPHF
jgi:dTDP-4-dehydrorhamnose 3,5-epimerase-like enzyme